MSMEWAIEQFADAPLGDLRRTDRLIKMASSIVSSPESGMSSMMGNEADNKAAYRFFSNESFDDKDILDPVFVNTIEKINESSRALLIQDTSHLNYDSKKATIDIGHIGTNADRSYQGLMMHWTLALDENGECLGAANLKLWSRSEAVTKKKPGEHQNKPIEVKESYKWIELVDDLAENIQDSTQAIWVADREADIYEFIDKVLECKQDFVIRANCNRVIANEEDLLKDRVRSAKVVGEQTLNLRKPFRGQSAVKVNIRCCDVGLLVQRRKGGAKSQKLCSDREIYAVHVSAEDPSLNFEWILLTSLRAESFAECMDVIGIYKQRWHIEEVHKTLKTGFKAEELTLNHADRLKKAIAVLLPCAIQVYWMSYNQKHNPDKPANNLLTSVECSLLSIRNKKPKHYIPTVKEAWLWIGYLGGFRGSRNSKPPGPLVFWRGLAKLQQMAIGAELMMASLE